MFPSNFFTVVPLFIMGSPFEVYFRFHMFLFMSVSCCMCLTIKCRKSPNRKKNCRKSHSRKLVYEQIIPGENSQTFVPWYTPLGRACVNVLCTIQLEGFYTEVFSTAGFYRSFFSPRGFCQFTCPSVSYIKCFDKIGILPSLSHKKASILSANILSMHRVICPATKCPSMKFPY